MRAISVLENAKSNRHRKTHRVDPDGTGRKSMHLARPGRRFGRSHARERKRSQQQGGPLSPLPANVYLDPGDKELEKRGVSFVRYADDIAIFAGSQRSAERIHEGIAEWIEKHLKVEVNRDKSGVGPTGNSSLPSFRIHEDGKVSVSPKAVEKLEAKVRNLWDARQSLTSEQQRDQWQRYIRGWWNYFSLAERRWEVTDSSGWIRRHMRKSFWLRQAEPGSGYTSKEVDGSVHPPCGRL